MQTQRDSWWSTGLLCVLTWALVSEVLGLLALAQAETFYALAWHTVAALASALAASRAAASAPDARPVFAAVVAFVLVLTLPALGLLGLLWVLLPHWVAARTRVADGVLELELPEFHVGEPVEFDAERGFSPIEDALTTDSPIEQRVQSVMALRRMDPQHAVPLLRVALADPSEDVRLLAYAILERREKQIRRRIARALATLRDADEPSATASARDRAALLRGLASDHWELVYSGFSEGDAQKLNLDHAARWANDALRASFDGTTALLLARVRLKQGEAGAAWRLIVAAEGAGVATHVCTPLLAEAAFLLRDFDCIPRLLAHVDGNPLHPPRLQPVAHFWNAEGSR